MHVIATATMKQYSRTLALDLVQKGPATFVWFLGSFRLDGAPNFRSADAARIWAVQNGIKVD